MLLAIDIGNTNVSLGIFRGEELLKTWRMATDLRRMPDEYAAMLIDLLRYENVETSEIKEVALCSTVPPMIAIFKELCEQYFYVTPLIIGPGVKTGVRIRLDNPRETGADRIVHAAAAHHLYGGPVIIVDMGTATVFDCVSKEGDYLGGAIAPGMGIASEALFTRPSMLYRVELTRPKNAIGTNTIAAIQSGIIFGYVGLVEGIVTRLQVEIGGDAKVVATGGYSNLITKETKIFDVVNPDLILIGLRLLTTMNRAT